ncbi:MAG: DNA internalization-related competence protein ComEC/Rec2 [Anaerolineae bacterium]|jgi:competence protein ComEC
MTLVYLAAAWTAGILLAKAVRLPWQLLPLLGLFVFLGLVLSRDQRRFRMGAVCALALGLGAGRFLLAIPRFDESSLAAYNDLGWVTIEGVVVREPDERQTHTNLCVRAEELTLPDGTERRVEGLTLARAKRYPRRQYGDRVQVEGLLETPPVFEDFSYRDYLARRGVYSLVDRAQVDLVAENQAHPLLRHLLALKRRAQEGIAQVLPEPQAALLTGILLGAESGIPEDLMQDFAATGTTHIIAISGFNITIVAGIFAGVSERILDRRRAVWVAVGAVVLYTILVGASAPVVRAAVMGLLYLLGRWLGRATYGPASLAAAVIGITAWNPLMLWDVGFLLSFAATAGLLLYTERWEDAFERALGRITSVERARRIVGVVGEALIVTVAAQIATVPILLAYFGRLSLVTLLANAVILPVQPYLMIAGGLATLLGLITQPLASIVGWVAWVFLTYTIVVVRLVARIPWASVPVQVDYRMVWGYYALLASLTWWLASPGERRRELRARLRSLLRSRVEVKVLMGTSVVLSALLLSAWRGLPDGRLYVTFLDVGQGDAIFIQTPSGRQVLVDGGAVPSVLLSRLGRRMPFWDRSLDLVVLTHPDLDHLSGLVSVMERYRVDAIVRRDMGCADPVCERWRELVEEEEAAVYRGEAGLHVDIEGELQLEVLHPGPELLATGDFNNNSIVMRLEYGQVSTLLTGDVEAEAEEQMLFNESRLESTVLKAAHHGGCDSTGPAFLEAVDPEVVVISVGADNEFGHPCEEVLGRLEGRTIYRTDQHGTVEMVSDGTRLWVNAER